MDRDVEVIPPPAVGSSPLGCLDDPGEGKALVMVFSCVLKRLLKANLMGGVSDEKKLTRGCVQGGVGWDGIMYICGIWVVCPCGIRVFFFALSLFVSRLPIPTRFLYVF